MAAVHARLAAQAATALAGIVGGQRGTKFTVAAFIQHCVLPRVTYSPQVSRLRSTTCTLRGLSPISEPLPWRAAMDIFARFAAQLTRSPGWCMVGACGTC